MARDMLHTAGFGAVTPAGETAPSAPACQVQAQVEEGWDPSAARALWARASTACVFNHPAWWGAAVDCYGAGRRILSVTARIDGEPCGYWLLWEKRMGPKDGCALILEPVGARHTDYVMPLVVRGREPAPVIAAMLAAVKARLSPASLLLWPKADAMDTADAAVRSAFPAARHLVHRHIRRCPRVTLPNDYETLTKRWSGNHRSQLRRRERRLREIGELTLEVAGTRAQVLNGLETMFAIHRVNWNGRGEGSEFDDPVNCRFIEAVAAGLPIELLHYSELRLGGKPLSCNFDFRLDDEILFYKGAFDIEYSRCSPGMVHTARVSEWAIGEGIQTLDFMQGEEPYKYLWADGVRETVSHAISPVEALPVWLWNAKLRKMIVEYKV